jgi:flagellar motor switch protein FliG
MSSKIEDGTTKLTGRQRAALVLVALGPDLSAKIVKELPEDEIEKITFDIANLPRVSMSERKEVIHEFYDMFLAHEYISEGGLEYAKEVLERVMGRQKALEVIQRLSAAMQVRPFDFARNADPAQLLNFIQNEHSQTIALILSFLHHEQAAAILSGLPPSRQADVAERLATMERTTPYVVQAVERILEKKISSFVTKSYNEAGGIDTIVEILNRADRTTEKFILESLEETNPELADEIKNMMFVFEDITKLDDRSIQRLLREVNSKDLAMALKTSSSEVRSRIYKNISSRARQMLEEDISYLGPVRVREVEDAQQRIVAIVRHLDELGEVLIARGGEDEIVV